MNTNIPVVNGDVLAGVQGFLQRLIQSGVVEAVYVPMRFDGEAIMPALVTDSSLLKQADPLAPVMPINGARAVSALTNKHTPAKLGAVLRPCEIRALVELVKLQQATLDGLTLISLDCPGTCEVRDYQWKSRENGFDLGGYLEAAQMGSTPEGMDLRPACQMCTQPVYEAADIHLQIFGADVKSGIPAGLKDEIATQLGETVDSQPGEGRKLVIEQLINRRGQTRQVELADIRKRIASNGGIAELFATCQRCHNCMTVCPICYCKTCLFRSESMNHAPEYYLSAAQRKGAVRLLSDTLLFHMTRLSHMELSCVSCGMCTSACPSDIPVGSIFSAIGEQVQATFEYQPGRDVGEALPMITFQANEWTEIGERQ
jgi:formate dehydrogenase (coenzyme F420) beta subunit